MAGIIVAVMAGNCVMALGNDEGISAGMKQASKCDKLSFGNMPASNKRLITRVFGKICLPLAGALQLRA